MGWIRVIISLFIVAPLTLLGEGRPAHVLAFAGSVRKDSFNKKLVRHAADLARQEGAIVKLIDLSDYPMPFYDADLETADGMPSQARQFCELLIQNDIILISTPEYNCSIPAVLKNSLDWASRHKQAGFSQETFQGKTFVLMSASPGKKGGAKGLAHLKAIVQDIQGQVVEAQLSLGTAHTAFDNNGILIDADFKDKLQQTIRSVVN